MHEFVGKWKIKWMETWPQDYVDLEVPGYFNFTEDGLGEFVFGAMKGFLDIRVSSRESFLEYSWRGECEGDEHCGRGWFEFATPDEGAGRLFIHCGDESGIKIER